MVVHYFEQPIPVTTELGRGYILYVKAGAIFDNDEFCVVLENGDIRHFLSPQLKVERNDTYGINNKKNDKEILP
jgi:hypothetical protein